MTQSVPFVERPKRLARSATKPVARIGIHLNATIVWTLCVVALGSAGMVAWRMHEPARETVVLSPQSQILPQGASTPSMAQFPGLVSPRSQTATEPLVKAPPVLAPAAIVSQPPEQSAELNRARAESAAVTASVSSVPASTWPVVTPASNGVRPRSDMRYQVNAMPQR